jgi:hypothetical protein
MVEAKRLFDDSRTSSDAGQEGQEGQAAAARTLQLQLGLANSQELLPIYRNRLTRIEGRIEPGLAKMDEASFGIKALTDQMKKVRAADEARRVAEGDIEAVSTELATWLEEEGLDCYTEMLNTLQANQFAPNLWIGMMHELDEDAKLVLAVHCMKLKRDVERERRKQEHAKSVTSLMESGALKQSNKIQTTTQREIAALYAMPIEQLLARLIRTKYPKKEAELLLKRVDDGGGSPRAGSPTRTGSPREPGSPTKGTERAQKRVLIEVIIGLGRIVSSE